MALSVADSFQGKQAIFIEAPTGSGKTLAYLLAALIFAVNEKEQVFISTNTKNLQQQIISEIPRIAKVLGAHNMRIADIKGISNYACRRRVEEETGAAAAVLEDTLARAYLANWAKRSSSGDLDDEISYWLRYKNPALNRLMNSVRCRREDCAGRECKFYQECFYNRKVKAMQDSHICTLNHSLLLTWPGGYPEIKRLLIDEAHALEEKAFEAFTREVKSFELSNFLERLAGKGERGFLYYLQFYGRKYLPALGIKPALGAVERIEQHAADIFRVLGPLNDNRHTLRLEIPRNNDGLEEVALNLSSALETLARLLQEIMDEISIADEDFKNTFLYKQGEEYMKTCRAWAALLMECFDEESEASCRYLESSQNSWSFRIAPLDVAELFHGKVISSCTSVLLTSATLAEKRGYGRTASVLGFDHLEPGRLVFAEPLPSVYDYGNNSVLAVPSDSPGYNGEGFADYVAKAVISAAKILGGRTMALFTSLERMQRVIAKARLPLEKEGISVLGGGNGSKRSDLEQFREDKNAVLFGSRGFFEGVDISGSALSCIIIDKLSFPYQDDPLLRARAKYLEKKGLNPFNELLLADVKRTLRQQFGRLIRSEIDRGFVLVLDQLGGGKRYCGSVMEELPGPQILQGVKLEEIMEKMKERFMEWGLVEHPFAGITSIRQGKIILELNGS
jgi:ATP-dependent DNA helicase DinG